MRNYFQLKMTHKSTPLEIQVLFIEEDDGRWSAQCLEFDIAAQARKLTDLRDEFDKVLFGYLEAAKAKDTSPQKILPQRAPQKYWQMYADAETDLIFRDQTSVSKERSVATKSYHASIRAA